jgi:ubiquinone/menaquinone biosynthesis C-methylase UbiE
MKLPTVIGWWGRIDMPEMALDKEAMRRFWVARGSAWDRWADVVATPAARMNEPLIAAAQLRPGLRLLDLASGAGEPALTIAERLGPAGEVVASDLVAEMLAGARRRAKALGLANMRFEFADMEALPFPDRRFDRVTCRFGIMFVPNAQQALAEVRRVLVSGGRAAFMVWGPREDTTMFRIIVAAADRILGHDPEHDMSAIFRFAEPGSLAGLFDRAGFVDIKEEDLRLSGSMPLGEPFWRPQMEMSLGTRIASVGAEKLRALETAIADAFKGEIQDDHYVLAAHTRIVSGSAP